VLSFYANNMVYAAKGNKDRPLNKDACEIDNNIPLKVFFINHIKVRLSCNLVNIFFPM
jgi:hypothetical protein